MTDNEDGIYRAYRLLKYLEQTGGEWRYDESDSLWRLTLAFSPDRAENTFIEDLRLFLSHYDEMYRIALLRVFNDKL